ncbi:MAG: DUF1361 domain-containing protein [Leptolyngbyaceae cyanobacterium bins.302]|nr:DUF1361 domain-containing protein [Leptolyngbyaceae cyanobacterium bins.302]
MSLWSVLPISSSWMRWNLFLALVPLALSVILFRLANRRSSLWWVGVLVFVAFLPNAPYILTDIIHLVEDIQITESLLVNTLITVPKYAMFILLGFGAYALSLVNLGLYLNSQGLSRWVLPAELMLHGLSAIGVKLGRFERFNSWDLLVQPGQVLLGLFQNLTENQSLLFMVSGAGIIAALYWGFKQIILALMLRYQFIFSEPS